ncbi:MAG TPA: cohesin domain-containing protein [Candidatus Saccharimonadales bacterium]|nr:cohesin domain-containing protein [Candidatus Saccharimonadales bacterium]
MSKRTIVLIILLVIVSGALLYTAAYQGQKQTGQMAQPMVTPVINAHTIISLSPSTTATNSVDVTINTMGDNVTAVQAEMIYDPAKIRNVKVTQGAFFNTPIVLFNQLDQKTGRVSYAIGIQPMDQPKKGAGTVATISYDLIPGAKGPIMIKFLPKTKVTAEGIAQSVLKTANSITINLPTGNM